MKTIKKYNIKNYGIESPQYWQGHSILYTNYDDLCIGIGDTEQEAFKDALEILFSSFDIQENKKLSELLEHEYNYHSNPDNSIFYKQKQDLKHDAIIDIVNNTTNTLSMDELEEIKDLLDIDKNNKPDKFYLQNISIDFDEWVEEKARNTENEMYWYVGIFVKFEETEEN